MGRLANTVQVARATAVAVALVVSATVIAQDTRPAFRAGVDVILVDAQVIGRDGQPVPGLTPESFDVRIGGQRRRVSAAEFIRAGDAAAVASAPASVAPGEAVPGMTPEQAMAGRRLFMLVIDGQSFDAGDSRGVAVAAQRFVDQLPETDLVGLMTYPQGPRVDPTTEHATVHRALDEVTGQLVNMTGRFTLQRSEVVDYFAGDREVIEQRHCGPRLLSPEQEERAAGLGIQCRDVLESEVAGLAGMVEAQARANLGTLRATVDELGKVPGRKVLVLVSAGMAVNDRPGGKPDVGDLPEQLGHAAARANLSIYALFVDHSLIQQFAPENRRAASTTVNMARESALLSRWLEAFSGAAGGTLVKAMSDSGDVAYAQIARETASHYLLTVEPDRSDRSGSARRIQVRVNERNANVRARQWVVLPAE